MDVDTLAQVKKYLYLPNLEFRIQTSKIKKDMLGKTFMLN